MSSSAKNRIYDGEEISIFNTLRFLLLVENLKKFLVVGAIGSALGVVLALTTPDGFTSSTKLLPITSSSSGFDLGGSGLSGIAGIAGFDISSLSSTSDIISPKDYASIAGSKDFKNKLLTHAFALPDRDITLLHYIREEHSQSLIGAITKLPWKILKFLKGEDEEATEFNPILVNEERMKIYEFLNENIQVGLNDETGLVDIYVTLQDPYLSYEVCKYIQNYLIDYVEEVTNRSLNVKLNYLIKIYETKQDELRNVQEELATLYDQNRNISIKAMELEMSNKNTEYKLIFTSVTEIQSEIQSTKIQLEKEGLVVAVIDPPFIPLENSEPNRVFILFITAFLFVFGLATKLFIGKVSEEMKDDIS